MEAERHKSSQGGWLDRFWVGVKVIELGHWEKRRRRKGLGGGVMDGPVAVRSESPSLKSAIRKQQSRARSELAQPSPSLLCVCVCVCVVI